MKRIILTAVTLWLVFGSQLAVSKTLSGTAIPVDSIRETSGTAASTAFDPGITHSTIPDATVDSDRTLDPGATRPNVPLAKARPPAEEEPVDVPSRQLPPPGTIRRDTPERPVCADEAVQAEWSTCRVVSGTFTGIVCRADGETNLRIRADVAALAGTKTWDYLYFVTADDGAFELDGLSLSVTQLTTFEDTGALSGVALTEDALAIQDASRLTYELDLTAENSALIEGAEADALKVDTETSLWICPGTLKTARLEDASGNKVAAAPISDGRKIPASASPQKPAQEATEEENDAAENLVTAAVPEVAVNVSAETPSVPSVNDPDAFFEPDMSFDGVIAEPVSVAAGGMMMSGSGCSLNAGASNAATFDLGLIAFVTILAAGVLGRSLIMKD